MHNHFSALGMCLETSTSKFEFLYCSVRLDNAKVEFKFTRDMNLHTKVLYVLG